jgi:hypothetical protein
MNTRQMAQAWQPLRPSPGLAVPGGRTARGGGRTRRVQVTTISVRPHARATVELTGLFEVGRDLLVPRLLPQFGDLACQLVDPQRLRAVTFCQPFHQRHAFAFQTLDLGEE